MCYRKPSQLATFAYTQEPQRANDYRQREDRMKTTNRTDRARLLPIDVVADLLNLSKATIYSWQSRRKGPPAVKIGSRLLFPEDELNAWIDRQPTRGSQVAA